MNYLFIDTECANPKYGSICTFGYFMTDENFVKIESEDILMNPETEYDPYVARNILRYSLSELDSNMPFPCYYDRIKELLCRKQTLVFGFSLSNDIRFLNETCMRYRLPSINCGFYDVQKIFSEYTHSKNEVSIEKAVKNCKEENAEISLLDGIEANHIQSENTKIEEQKTEDRVDYPILGVDEDDLK